jgi:hypothetical protein
MMTFLRTSMFYSLGGSTMKSVRQSIKQSISRDLAVGLSITTVLFVGALAWGRPFVAASSGAAAAQTQPDRTPAKTFTGTVVKNGDQYVLRDAGGQTFKLDYSESPKPYEGKAVKVVGELDEQAMVIHVQSIEGTEA